MRGREDTHTDCSFPQRRTSRVKNIQRISPSLKQNKYLKIKDGTSLGRPSVAAQWSTGVLTEEKERRSGPTGGSLDVPVGLGKKTCHNIYTVTRCAASKPWGPSNLSMEGCHANKGSRLEIRRKQWRGDQEYI